MTANVTKTELKTLLTNLHEGDTLEIVTREGQKQVLVLSEPLSKEDIIERRWPELIGKPITVGEAAKKYKIGRPTIFKWVQKGYISILDKDAYPMPLDAAEVEYCVQIYEERKKTGIGFYGAPLLDDHGLPYQLKRPDVAEYRQRKNA